MRRVPDPTLCRELLGVEAHVSLEEGLLRTIDWQRKRHEDDGSLPRHGSATGT